MAPHTQSVTYWLLWWSYCVPYGSVLTNSMQTPSVETSATGTFLGCLPNKKKKREMFFLGLCYCLQADKSASCKYTQTLSACAFFLKSSLLSLFFFFLHVLNTNFLPQVSEKHERFLVLWVFVLSFIQIITIRVFWWVKI